MEGVTKLDLTHWREVPLCAVCGRWNFPRQAWMHKGCVAVSNKSNKSLTDEPVSLTNEAQQFDKAKYQREYMAKKRADKKSNKGEK